MNPYHEDLIRKGLARWHKGRLIPVMRGGDGSEDEPRLPFAGSPFADFTDIPEDLSGLSVEEIAQLHVELARAIAEVSGNPSEFVSATYKAATLIEAVKAAAVERDRLAAEIAARPAPELTDDEIAALAEAASEPEVEETAETTEVEAAAVETEPEAEEPEPVVASGRRGRLPAPVGREISEHVPAVTERAIPLVAAAGCRDLDPGTPFRSEQALAEAMIRRHADFGATGSKTVEKFTIARANLKSGYPDERVLGMDEEHNWDLIRRVTDGASIKRALRARIREQDALVASGEDVDAKLNLIASGGLCAPVTPYYNLQFISSPVRPVMGSLPSFAADRGGLRYARPAALSAVTTAVGLITEAEDAAGGTQATKTCQVIPCPPFQETDVDIIYHCLQFGNLGARTFPELVAQWNNLVLAAHARLAESNLLTIIDQASTQVHAGSMGLGASASLFSQILAAANGLRSRNRMDPEAVLRIMLPWWAADLIVSDVIRTQFERFDTDRARVTALLRSFNVEPTWYIDGANTKGQVFGAQTAGALLPFPSEVVWYLFPEGSFLFLDSGQLELGIVRDSVLNATNDFQIFGETFESVAFVGVESLAVTSTICDSGTVSLPHAVTCPINYSIS